MRQEREGNSAEAAIWPKYQAGIMAPIYSDILVAMTWKPMPDECFLMTFYAVILLFAMRLISMLSAYDAFVGLQIFHAASNAAVTLRCLLMLLIIWYRHVWYGFLTVKAIILNYMSSALIWNDDDRSVDFRFYQRLLHQVLGNVIIATDDSRLWWYTRMRRLYALLTCNKAATLWCRHMLIGLWLMILIYVMAAAFPLTIDVISCSSFVFDNERMMRSKISSQKFRNDDILNISRLMACSLSFNLWKIIRLKCLMIFIVIRASLREKWFNIAKIYARNRASLHFC